MANEGTPGRPTTRRYSPEDKARAVRLVRQLRKELGTSHGTIRRVADQIGCGVESLRTWVKQADIDDGVEPGLTSVEAKRIKELEQENRELRRANDLLRRASAFFASMPQWCLPDRGSLVSSLPRPGLSDRWLVLDVRLRSGVLVPASAWLDRSLLATSFALD